MTREPVPDTQKRIANWVGRVFHPAVIAVPTLALVLSDLGWQAALYWSAVTLPIVLLPGLLLVGYLRTRGKYTYQRRTRTPLYITAWLSVIAAAALTAMLGAPRVLLACLLTLAVWLPVQLAVNTFITKISTHAAVVMGCISGLLLLGKLPTLPWQLLGLGMLLLVAWARVHDRNHTVRQVVLGILVALVSVLGVFPLVLRS
ncbi:MAG: hypothetical protein SF123_04245 [Chloroflexota bacterium]|nr:hypothetical protein [Chloroflexota bacterium]